MIALEETMEPIGLELSSCRVRQDRLRAHLVQSNLAAALITDARHVFYFSGHWTRSIWPAALVVHREASKPTTLVADIHSAWPVAVDEVVRCELNHNGTIIDDTNGVVWK